MNRNLAYKSCSFFARKMEKKNDAGGNSKIQSQWTARKQINDKHTSTCWYVGSSHGKFYLEHSVFFCSVLLIVRYVNTANLRWTECDRFSHRREKKHTRRNRNCKNKNISSATRNNRQQQQKLTTLNCKMNKKKFMTKNNIHTHTPRNNQQKQVEMPAAHLLSSRDCFLCGRLPCFLHFIFEFLSALLYSFHHFFSFRFFFLHFSHVSLVMRRIYELSSLF